MVDDGSLSVVVEKVRRGAEVLVEKVQRGAEEV